MVYLNSEHFLSKDEFNVRLAESGPVVSAQRAQLDYLIAFYRFYSQRVLVY